MEDVLWREFLLVAQSSNPMRPRIDHAPAAHDAAVSPGIPTLLHLRSKIVIDAGFNVLGGGNRWRGPDRCYK